MDKITCNDIAAFQINREGKKNSNKKEKKFLFKITTIKR